MVGAVKETQVLTEKLELEDNYGPGHTLRHVKETLHVLHNIMFKNGYLDAWPNKGMDDACPISICNKFRYVMKVLPSPSQSLHTSSP